MAIVKKIDTVYDFVESIPQSRKDQFSSKGWEELFYHLDALSDDIGEDVAFDAAALCCDYVEYDGFESFLSEYDLSLTEMGIIKLGDFYMPESDYCEGDDDVEHERQYNSGDYDDALLELIQDYLSENTMSVCVESDCIMFQCF